MYRGLSDLASFAGSRSASKSVSQKTRPIAPKTCWNATYTCCQPCCEAWKSMVAVAAVVLGGAGSAENSATPTELGIPGCGNSDIKPILVSNVLSLEASPLTSQASVRKMTKNPCSGLHGPLKLPLKSFKHVPCCDYATRKGH